VGEPPLSALDLLILDHRKVQTLLDKVEGSDAEGKRVILRSVQEELTKHSAVEEELIYPILRAVGNLEMHGKGTHMADSVQREHWRALNNLHRLIALSTDDSEWMRLFREVKEDLHNHADEEEIVLFPFIQRKVPAALLVDAAEVVDVIKTSPVAVSRINPTEINSAPTVSGKIHSLLDRVYVALGGVHTPSATA
jgi:hemerythrin superfamily protein